MDNPPKIPSGYADRTLRIIMVVAFFPALAFLSACVFSYLFVPTVGLIPMGMSCLVSMTALGSKKDDSYVKYALPGADFATATFLMVMMVLRYVVPRQQLLFFVACICGRS